MAWWQEAMVYEVYVRSFRDADGDGVGDLTGVFEKLGYLAELGVDPIWLTPIHPSADVDVGYDVADYVAIDPRLGTLYDVGRLLRAAHAHGIRVLLDLVVNHTSDRHPWFAASRASRKNRRRDWYIWRAGPPEAAPTNWRSIAGGSAWQYDAESGEHYLHTFLPEQPDLNWRNADVRAAIADAMRFWLARGVDGFRVDALPLLVNDARFRDNPPDPRWRPEQSDYDRNVDGRCYRVVARIDDGAPTTPLPVRGRVLLRASQPMPEASALVDAVTLAGPDAAAVELAGG